MENLTGDKGWRTSLAIAGLPALILTVSSILLPETPNSLAERGQVEKARRVLKDIRGTDDVDAEMDDIIAAAEEAAQVHMPVQRVKNKSVSKTDCLLGVMCGVSTTGQMGGSTGPIKSDVAS